MSLFNNPMVQNAKKAMTIQQIRDYELKGEDMYNTVDFETNEIKKNNLELEMLLDCIKSGMKYSSLTDEDKELLFQEYGQDFKYKLFK